MCHVVAFLFADLTSEMVVGVLAILSHLFGEFLLLPFLQVSVVS